jgi:exo-beta-1,3-glucanase (GH17 family)
MLHTLSTHKRYFIHLYGKGSHLCRQFVLPLLSLVLVILVITTLIPLPLANAQPTVRYFPETQHYLKGRFLKYWNEHGGLAQQGYPLTEEFQERSQLDGQTYTVQYFERAVFEYHPEYAGTPYEVLLSQLGKYQLDARYPGGNEATTPVVGPINLPTTSPIPLESWRLSGDYVTHNMSLGCAQALPEAVFILGGNPTTCGPSAGQSMAAVTFAIPPNKGTQVLVLHVTCAGASSCADSVTADNSEGRLAIAVNGQTLWTALCPTAGKCDARALGQTPAVAFVTAAPAQLEVQLTASPHVRWPVAGLQIELRELPTLDQGVAYSPFRDCQNPNWGPFPTEEQIREDLALVRHMGNAIRTYSSIGVQGQIPVLARKVGLRVSAGAWLGKDKERNEEEITSLIALAQQVDLESVIVGNEVLLRNDLTEDQLIGYIQRVKAAVQVPVTTAEIGGILLQHPRVMDAVDYQLVHLYAYWDGVPIENAARYVVDQYHQIQQWAGGKRVVIGETGWPAAGPANGHARPSLDNQRRFLREFLTLAQQGNVEFYYFAAADELWKTEGGVGPYWGVLYPDRRNKYDLQSVLIPVSDVVHPIPDPSPIPLGPAKAEGTTFPIYTNYAAPDNHFAPSGWMGDLHAIHFNDCAYLEGPRENRVIEIRYAPNPGDAEGWAGIYWLEPENNWGTSPRGYDLRGFAQLRFRARSTAEGAQAKFFVGGVFTGTFPSSIPRPVYAQEADSNGFVNLSPEWRDFHIDLRGTDLSHVIDGFGWVAERARTPAGVTFDLDEIIFDQQPPPVIAQPPPPAPTATPADFRTMRARR